MTEYKCLLLDPPWNEKGGGKVKRGADRHYETMKVEDILAEIKASGYWTPYRNAHVWMWVTDNFLKHGLWLMDALGAEYKRTVSWVKTTPPDEALLSHMGEVLTLDRFLEIKKALSLQMGLGQYLRGTKETLLFGTIGAGQAQETWKGHRDIRDTIRARRTTHSRKPEESYLLIEDVTRGPRVEFFATKHREGWTPWGRGVGVSND